MQHSCLSLALVKVLKVLKVRHTSVVQLRGKDQ